MIKLWVALAFIGLNFYIYHFLASEEVIPPRKSFEEFPLQLGDWACSQREEMDPEAAETLGVSDYLICGYRNQKTGDSVGTYVGYHESQVRRLGGSGDETVIHTPEHCLPGSGWDIIDSRIVPLDFEGLPQGHGLRASGPQAKRFVVAKGRQRRLVYFWYQAQGRTVTNNEDVILFRFWDRATKGRTDGSLVRFTIPITRGDVDRAEAQFRDLAPLVVAQLGPYIPE